VAKPSNVMFAADRDRNLWISITKDPDVTLMLARDDLARHLDIVRLETYDTIRDAIARLRAIKKMSLARRRKLVQKSNPDWKPVGSVPLTQVTPAGDTLRWDGDEGAGGVHARIFVPLGPRSGSAAQALPEQTD
jgi:hypothetical protein